MARIALPVLTLLAALPLAACSRGGTGATAADDAAAGTLAAPQAATAAHAGLGVGLAGVALDYTPTPLVEIPALDYRPLYPAEGEDRVRQVAAFRIEQHAVTNAQYRAFVAANPRWRRSQVAALHADDGYLAHWDGDLEFAEDLADAPVVRVSWFAARAYAQWIGRRLPTLAEWEACAAASETAVYGREEEAFAQRILDWYARPVPARLPAVRSTFRSALGLWDMHGLVWEWVEDFNSALVTGESRGDVALDRELFCGSASLGSADPTDYAAFMRFAYRSGLRGEYAVANLGFRCAADAAEAPAPCCAPVAAAADDPLPETSLYLLETEFTDARGRTRVLEDFRGRPLVVAMIFTHCEYACPRTLSDLQGIEAALDEAERAGVGFLLVSFDSARDTPPVLADYARRKALDPQRWTLLHGGPDEVREVAAALGVQYQQMPGGAFAHSNRLTVLDAEGRVAGRLDGLGVDPAEGAALVRRAAAAAPARGN